MIELYYWPTPNGHKIALFLEESATPYEIKPVNINKGDQFKPEFLAISPNNRMPAIIDRVPADGGAPVSVFESGAILLYLADKTRKFIPQDLRGRVSATEWLFWQVGGLGPMAGQNHHFNGREFICGDAYTIADMASYPWIASHGAQKQDLDDFPNVKRWFAAIKARPATQRVYAKGEEINPPGQPMTDEAKRILFGHGK